MMSVLQPYDIFVIIVLLGTTLWGGLKGIVSQIMSIVSLVLSWYAASQFFTKICGLIPVSEVWQKPIAMLVIFVGAFLAIHFLSHFFQTVLRQAKLKEFDRQMGALLGFFKGVVLCIIITYFGIMFFEQGRELIAKSKSGRIFVLAISYLESLTPDNEKHQAIKTALDRFIELADESGMETNPEKLSDEISRVKESVERKITIPSEEQLKQDLTQKKKEEKAVATSQGTSFNLEKLVNDFFPSFSAFSSKMISETSRNNENATENQIDSVAPHDFIGSHSVSAPINDLSDQISLFVNSSPNQVATFTSDASSKSAQSFNQPQKMGTGHGMTVGDAVGTGASRTLGAQDDASESYPNQIVSGSIQDQWIFSPQETVSKIPF